MVSHDAELRAGPAAARGVAAIKWSRHLPGLWLEGGDGFLRRAVMGLQEVQVAGMGIARTARPALSAGRLDPGRAVPDRVIKGLKVCMRPGPGQRRGQPGRSTGH
jgi:hypothetical protein